MNEEVFYWVLELLKYQTVKEVLKAMLEVQDD